MTALGRRLGERHRKWESTLAAALRAEFDVEVYMPADGDPVLGRALCRVAGCAALVTARGICDSHHRAWTAAGKTDLDAFVAAASPVGRQARTRRHGFDLFRLGSVARREVAYVLQCRHDQRAAPLTPRVVASLVELLRRSAAPSLLDRPLEAWLADLAPHVRDGSFNERALLRYAYARLEDLAAGGDPDIVYARDTWDARRLGIEAHRGPHRISFAAIHPIWLADAAKRWARFRLATGTKFSTLTGDVAAMRRFSQFLTTRTTPLRSEADLDRNLIEDYLLCLAQSGLSAATRTGLLVDLKIFLDHARRHRLLPRLPADAVVYGKTSPDATPPCPASSPSTSWDSSKPTKPSPASPTSPPATSWWCSSRPACASAMPARWTSIPSSPTPPPGRACATTTPKSAPRPWCRSPSGPPPPSSPNKPTCGPVSRPGRHCFSPANGPTPTGTGPTCPSPFNNDYAAGPQRSTCATRPAVRSP